MVWDPRIRFPDRLVDLPEFNKKLIRLHLMPIITPAFPEQNSTPNVTTSAKSIILKEMKTGELFCYFATHIVSIKWVDFYKLLKLFVLC